MISLKLSGLGAPPRPPLSFHVWIKRSETNKMCKSDQFASVTKRCRLSWLTNSALVYEPKSGGWGRVAGPARWGLGTWNPNKLWRSSSIFYLCHWHITPYRNTLSRLIRSFINRKSITVKGIILFQNTAPSCRGILRPPTGLRVNHSSHSR